MAVADYCQQRQWIFLQHASVRGYNLGFEMYRSRGKRKIALRQKKGRKWGKKKLRTIEKQTYSHPKVSNLGSTPTPWSGPFRDHGLDPPLSTVNPMHEGVPVSAAPFLDLVSQTPRPRGKGRPLFAEKGKTWLWMLGVFAYTILFEIIAFLIRKSLLYVTATIIFGK